MLVYLYSIGTFSGTLIGCIGTLIYCILINVLRDMPGWALGNLVIGITVGTVINLMKPIKNKLIQNIIIIISIAIGCG